MSSVLATLNERGVAYALFILSEKGVASVSQCKCGRCDLRACQILRRCLLVTFKKGGMSTVLAMLNERGVAYTSVRPSEEGRGVVFHKAFFFLLKSNHFPPIVDLSQSDPRSKFQPPQKFLSTSII